MKPSDIKVGKTYVNKGSGRTRRTVIDIGEHIKFQWFGRKGNLPLHPIGVKYEQEGIKRAMWLNSFAQWVGYEVEG